MLFWGISLVLTAAVGATLLRAISLRGAEELSAEAYDIAVFRDQLSGVERDLARGVITPEDAQRLKIEISRKILEADRAMTAAAAPAKSQTPRLVAVVVVVALLAGSFALYDRIGAPGYPDLPIADRIARANDMRADRPSQAEAEADAPKPEPRPAEPEFLDLMAKLREAVARRPADIEGQRLLARNESVLGNFGAAAEAQQRLIALSGDKATATDYAALADIYIQATGGYVSPEAEEALSEALRRDPRDKTSRFYTGLMFGQTGRPDLAFRFWRPLLEEGPETAPWIPFIRTEIEALADAAGVNYTPPAAPGASALAGPSAADVAAAGQMTDAERQDMIRGMVGNLETRLFDQGGDVAEWVRLIGALGVLGDADRGKEALTRARAAFAADPAALDQIAAAAARAGLSE